MTRRFLNAVALVGVVGLLGCSSQPPPAAMAPPVQQTAPVAAPVGAPPQDMGVYNWRDVPQGQRVPVQRARFDQGGYQLYCATGETIVVPFENQNLYVMKFGRAHRDPSYFVNEGVPVLYLNDNDYLENAAAQNARWYPIPRDYNYTRPIYVSVAPSWSAYTSMGWYPGMVAYGGVWGYSPGVHFNWMPSFAVNIGGTYYRSYDTYRSYYASNPGYVRNRVVYNNYNTRSTGSWGSGRSAYSTGSFRSSGRSGGTGSFGTGRVSGSGSFGTGRASGFGSAGGSGSFGTGSSTGSAGFGSGRSMGGGGSFGSGSFGSRAPSGGSAFGSGGRSSGTGSFGSAPSSGSAFGGRSSGSSFGGGGGGSFGSSSRSSGSSFGGTRSMGGGGSSFGGGRSGGSSFGSGRSSGASGSSFRSSGSFGGGRSSSSGGRPR